jgi:hypothetical protein
LRHSLILKPTAAQTKLTLLRLYSAQTIRCSDYTLPRLYSAQTILCSDYTLPRQYSAQTIPILCSDNDLDKALVCERCDAFAEPLDEACSCSSDNGKFSRATASSKPLPIIAPSIIPKEFRQLPVPFECCQSAA